jgi:hypothetical protein
MSASSTVVYLNPAEASRALPSEPTSIPTKQAAWRKLSLFRSRAPTPFQLCLALHMFVAERYSALD